MNPFYDLPGVPQAHYAQPIFFLFSRSGRFIRLLKIQYPVVSFDTRVSRITQHANRGNQHATPFIKNFHIFKDTPWQPQ